MHPVRHLLLNPRLGPYLDGELDPALEARVLTHLRECWRCSGELELQRLIRSALRQSRATGPSSLAVTRLRRFAASARRATPGESRGGPVSRKRPPGKPFA